jgi:hypothetical protein
LIADPEMPGQCDVICQYMLSERRHRDSGTAESRR